MVLALGWCGLGHFASFPVDPCGARRYVPGVPWVLASRSSVLAFGRYFQFQFDSPFDLVSSYLPTGPLLAAGTMPTDRAGVLRANVWSAGCVGARWGALLEQTVVCRTLMAFPSVCGWLGHSRTGAEPVYCCGLDPVQIGRTLPLPASPSSSFQQRALDIWICKDCGCMVNHWMTDAVVGGRLAVRFERGLAQGAGQSDSLRLPDCERLMNRSSLDQASIGASSLFRSWSGCNIGGSDVLCQSPTRNV